MSAPFFDASKFPFDASKFPEAHKPRPVAAREQLLQDAATLIMGDRNVQYGDPNADFARTAALWQTYLDGISERQLMPHDVAVMMMLLKVSRLAWSPNKRDHWLDIAGYAGCGFDCVASDFAEIV